jgi:hypothetical protein
MHVQQVTGKPATEQTVWVQAGCVAVSHCTETNDPVNVPDPP